MLFMNMSIYAVSELKCAPNTKNKRANWIKVKWMPSSSQLTWQPQHCFKWRGAQTNCQLRTFQTSKTCITCLSRQFRRGFKHWRNLHSLSAARVAGERVVLYTNLQQWCRCAWPKSVFDSFKSTLKVTHDETNYKLKSETIGFIYETTTNQLLWLLFYCEKSRGKKVEKWNSYRVIESDCVLLVNVVNCNL